jgi:D-alanyl-D-alanine carboxypeptidase/D-alanyl-D-alanine-endopeptidase (penicillin-binding protein 4)
VGVATALLIWALASPAAADTATSAKSKQSAATSRTSTLPTRNVIKAATRTDDVAGNVPRTALATVTSLEERLFTDLHRLATGPALRRGTTAIYIADARTGEAIYALHEDAPLNPASNVKLIATAATMDVLGPDWRYRTRLFGPTPDASGVANGDVYLRGSFDPTFGVSHLDRLATRVVERGIHRVDGDVLVGDPGRDAVAIAKLEIKINAGAVGGPPEITVEPASDYVEVLVGAKTFKRGRTKLKVTTSVVTDELGHDKIQVQVTGRIRRGAKRSYWRVVRNRSLFTAHAMRAALQRAGVQVTGTARTVEFSEYVRMAGPSYLPVQLATHRSATMAAIIARVNKRSINRLADRVVMTAGAAAFGGEPTMAKGVRLMQHWLASRAEIDPAEVVLDTGSGLSYKTQLSARNVVTVLRQAAGLRDIEAGAEPSATERAWRKSLSIAGRDGTLRRRFRKTGLRGHLFGKTGTLTRIISLSGIIAADDGTPLAFAIVTNDHRPGYRYNVRKQHEALVKAMYSYANARPPAAAAAAP